MHGRGGSRNFGNYGGVATLMRAKRVRKFLGHAHLSKTTPILIASKLTLTGIPKCKTPGYTTTSLDSGFYN